MVELNYLSATKRNPDFKTKHLECLAILAVDGDTRLQTAPATTYYCTLEHLKRTNVDTALLPNCGLGRK